MTDIISPTDGKPMLETLRGYKSQDGELTIYKVMSGRKIEEAEVRELVENGEIGPLDGFVSAKTGNRFPSKIKIVDDEKKPGEKKAELDFGNKFDVNALEPFWTDPENRRGTLRSADQLRPARTRTARLERDLQSRPPDVPEARSRASRRSSSSTQGKTDLIEKFTSKKGRPFDAFLVRQGAEDQLGNFRRANRAKARPKTARQVRAKPKAPLDLSKAVKLGESKIHDGDLYQTEDAFVVAKPQADGSPRVVFELKRNLCGKEITAGRSRASG